MLEVEFHPTFAVPGLTDARRLAKQVGTGARVRLVQCFELDGLRDRQTDEHAPTGAIHDITSWSVRSWARSCHHRPVIAVEAEAPDSELDDI